MFIISTSAISVLLLTGTLGLYALSFVLKHYKITGETKRSTLDFSKIQPLLGFDHSTALPRAYRPWKAGKYNMTMGIRKMPEDEWLIIDKLYTEEQKFKEYLLERDIQAVLQCLPDAEAACTETLECVVNFMTRRYPDHFILLKGQPGYIHNAITRKTFRITKPFEQHPLVVAAQLAMEDINLLLRGSEGESQDYHL